MLTAARSWRGVGRELASTADGEARRVGETDLGEAPLLLRSGVLDVAVANAGLGRVALDLTARQTTSAIGIMLRPPVAALGAGFRAFYEGFSKPC